MTPLQRIEHRTELLLRRRCPDCAETAPAGAVLRGEVCLSCGSDLVVEPGGDHAARMLQAVREDWNRWRLLVYGMVLVTSFVAGFVPMAGTLVAVVAMFAGHLMLLRRPLRWLSPARRVVTRLAIKLWFGILGMTSFLANVLAAPLVAAAGLGVIASAFVGMAVLALYLEGSLELVSRRIAREATQPRLAFWEWAIPVGLTIGLTVLGIGGVLLLWIVLNGLAATNVPSVAELARWLLEVP